MTGGSKIIVIAMMFFMVLGALDRIFGNRLKLGEKFEEGFGALGALALGMVGINCIAPVLGQVLAKVVGPAFLAIGADPSISGSILLSIDTGGYALAHTMAANSEIANFSAIILGSMMAPTLTFGIPVALGVISKQDSRFLAAGTLCGIIAIPFACFIGGVMAKMPVSVVLVNLIPIFIFSLLIAAGLMFKPDGMIRGFSVFAKIMIAFITAILASAILSETLGITIIKGMAPLSEAFTILGTIAIMLAGAYPMIFCVTTLLKLPLGKISRILGVNEHAVGGMLAATANSIPMFNMVKDMDDKGKLYSFAFACCASFALGDHLGFCAAVEPNMVVPMVVSKLFGGVLAVWFANIFYRTSMNKSKSKLKTA